MRERGPGGLGELDRGRQPELDPEGRRAVLERLGVDLDRPLTLGLDTETTESGARYWLRSGILNGRVHLGVEPT